MLSLLVDGLGAGLAFQNQFSVLVQFKFSDDNFRRVNADRNSGAVGLFTLYTLNVNGKLSSVALHDFARLLTLVVTSGYLFKIEFYSLSECATKIYLILTHHDFVILADGNATYVVFFT